IAAEACGAAHGRVLFCVDVFGRTRERFLELYEQQPEGERVDPLGEWLEGYARKYGFEFSEDLVTGQFTVDQIPPSLGGRARGLEYVPMRYVPYGGRAVVPEWLRGPAERRRVALTLGLSATEIFRGYTVDVREVLMALGGVDAEIVATVPEVEQERVGPVPENVRMVSFVPWRDLVATCDAVVHHAGAASLATTALYPVPHLSLHYHFDQPYLARRLAEHGAGLELHTSEVTGEAVREAVDRLLDEPVFGER
ncbi:nucleotide disphospho-sugar-binding domain-containing protein, partial [Nocardiopsis xinjiangensis]|uniref:nucleotide disphospho-sugar-binding domain-containing protein n=1 Tax=Nocardiopsis xinjiangensis TaxID=124285 RepID=UPI000380CA55